jgi:alanyl-tRNA synthetase
MTTETARLYFEDPYQTEFEAEIVERRVHEGRPSVVLDRTCFYAESGGQPWDLGTLNDVPVVKVIEDEGSIVHVLEKELSGDRVQGRVDWARRFDHMQQHTGQHVLSQAFIEVLKGETRSFHLGAEESSLEIGLANASEESLDRVERRANDLIFDDLPVKTYFVPPDRIAEVPLRRPPKVEGTVRVVEVDGVEYSACGGTHVRRTGEIGQVKILSAERIRGNLRFTFVCGGRALAAFQLRNRIVRDLVGRFNVQAKDVPASVAKLSDELKDLKKRFKKVEEKLAGYEASEYIAKSEGQIISAVLDEKSPDAARALALSIVRQGRYFVCFGARSEARSHILLARSEALSMDLRSLVPMIAPLINGKGGGGPSLVEIAGDLNADLAATVTQAAERIKEAGVA